MMAARVEAAELAKRMRFAMSPGGLLIHGEVMRLFYAALPYVEAAAAQPVPEPNCPRCEDPEAPTLHRHPPAPEPGDADAVISAVIRKYGLEPKEPTATAQRARELLLSAPITHRQWGLDVRDFLREIAEETK